MPSWLARAGPTLLALRLPPMGDVELEGYCPACYSDVEAWEPGPRGRPRAGCPICGSLERHRFLALTLQGLRPVLASATHLLDAAPQPQVERVVRSLAPNIAYVRTDLLDLRWADVCADAVELPFVDGSFDLIIHFHVFEHIPDDRAAMRRPSPGPIEYRRNDKGCGRSSIFRRPKDQQPQRSCLPEREN